MIKMLCQVTRKPGLTEEEFYPRYLRGHGDLVRKLARPMGFLRYVQAHRMSSPEVDGLVSGRGACEPLDGQSELWWDSWVSMEAALSSPDGIEASGILEIDEQEFTDTAKVSGFIAKAETIFDHSDGSPPGTGASVKLVVDMWKRPDLSAADFGNRWLTEHGNLVRRLAKAMGISKYVQNRRDPMAEFDFAELRGWQPAPDGVAEMWWPSIEAMTTAMAKPEAIEADAMLRANEAEFLDPSRLRSFLGKEHTIFDYISTEMPAR